jgi:hypothetical protein
MKEKIIEILKRRSSRHFEGNGVYSQVEYLPEISFEDCADEIIKIASNYWYLVPIKIEEIERRMPTDEDIEKQFPSGGLREVIDGKFNVPATMEMYDNLNRQAGAKWFRSRMKGEGK